MNNHEERSLLEEVRDCGVLRITAHWDGTREQYLDPSTGEPSGIVGLVGRLLAGDLGVQPEFVELPWAEHIPALLAGRADISVKHTLTPLRAFDVEFTIQPLFCEDGRIVLRTDNTVQEESDLNQPGRTIAVARGASQVIHIRRRYPRAGVLVCSDENAALEAVAAGTADACLHDTLVPGFLAAHPQCAVLTDQQGQPVSPYRDCVHPCIRPGDPRFLNWLNSWMAFHGAAGTFLRLIDQATTAHIAAFSH